MALCSFFAFVAMMMQWSPDSSYSEHYVTIQGKNFSWHAFKEGIWFVPPLFLIYALLPARLTGFAPPNWMKSRRGVWLSTLGIAVFTGSSFLFFSMEMH